MFLDYLLIYLVVVWCLHDEGVKGFYNFYTKNYLLIRKDVIVYLDGNKKTSLFSNVDCSSQVAADGCTEDCVRFKIKILFIICLLFLKSIVLIMNV
jgi:hypothetical protein